MEALKDSNVDMIGVYGMGGVGKTTLVKQVAKQVMEDKSLFDEVVMAEVTQTPDHKTIQDKLARDLGLEFPQHESVFERADRLRRRLKKEKRVLIILDNIWTKLELYDVGIPVGDDENKSKDKERRCTIILTSRSLDLLRDEMNCKNNFSVAVLSKKEAEQLFEKIVGEKTKKSDFQPIAAEIVERCGGLPVALNTIANALKDKSLPNWKNALGQLRNSNLRKIQLMDANVYSSIELSYKLMEDEEAKDLFLLCALHPAGDRIRVPYLLRYGVGLGLFENVYTLEAARNRVHSLIGSLKASSLLLDGDTEDWVKMHDIIHDVAVSIAKEKLMFNIPNVDDLKEEIEKTIQKGPAAISLPRRDVLELPDRLACPKLKLFFLFTSMYGSLQIPDLFFEGTVELRVLDWPGIDFPSLPSSLGHLINLQTLCLDYCQLEDVAIIGELTKLEILSFQDSDIKQLPVAIGQLTRLRLLDLRNCHELEVIAPNVLSRLSRLEELYMGRYSFTRWAKVEERSNASLVELKGLSKLTTLDIYIPDAEMVPQDLFPVELKRYWIRIGNLKNPYGHIYPTTSRLMEINGIEKNILLGLMMKMLWKRIECLLLKELKGFQNIDDEGFQHLRHFHVEKCSEVLHITRLVGRIGRNVFPLLESLNLHNLVNLEKICHNELIEYQSFSNLRIMKLTKCHKLKHLFSFSMAKNLLQLQEIHVSDCKSLYMIVGPDVENPTTSSASKEIITENAPNENVIFPSLAKFIVDYCEGLKCLFSYSMVKSLMRLQHLEISNCDSMTCVFDTTSTELEFPSLLHLKIDDCSNLRRFISMSSSEDNIHAETQPQSAFFDEKVRLPSLEVLNICWMKNSREIWHHQLASDSFSKLKELEILGCDKIMNIIPPMGGLPNLEVLQIGSMKNLRETWHHQFASGSFSKLKELKIWNCKIEQMIIFPPMVTLPNLEVLTIKEMKNMREIWHHQLASDSFSKLKELKISSCDELMNIFPPMMEFPNLLSLSVSHCNNIEEIIGEEVQENLIAFNQLKRLRLVELPRLVSFCLGNYTLQFPTLERVIVRACPNMKIFSQGVLHTPKLHEVHEAHEDDDYVDDEVHWEGNLNSTIQKMFKEMVGFRDLKKLKLSLFPSLREKWHGQELPFSFFNNLTSLVVDDCMNMSTAIPANMLRCLNNLEELEVRNCDSLEAVFYLEEQSGDEQFGPLFPRFSYLKLIDLPKLKRFCNFTGNIIELPSLSTMQIVNCPKMVTFISDSTHVRSDKETQEMTTEQNAMLADMKPLFDEKVAFPELWWLKLSKLPELLHLWKENSQHSQVLKNLRYLEVTECGKLEDLLPASVSFQNMLSLEVSKCDGLLNLMTLSTIESLVNLERMNITDCKKIERIIQQVGIEEKKNCIVFDKMEYLILHCLPSLACFCLGNPTLEFPSLERVVVSECPKMKTFSDGVLHTPKLHKLQVKKEEEEEEDDDEGRWEGSLNSIVQQLFKETNSKED